MILHPFTFETIKENIVTVSIGHMDFPLSFQGKTVLNNIRVFFNVQVVSKKGEKLHNGKYDHIVPLDCFDQFDGFTDRIGPVLLTPAYVDILQGMKKLYIGVLRNQNGAGYTYNGRTPQNV